MRIPALLATLLLALPSAGAAQFVNESLVQTLPPGYKVDYHAQRGNRMTIEMVPQAESVNAWTEMVTAQIFFGLKNATPDQFEASMAQQWGASCKEGAHKFIAKGEENGYPFALWVQTCPRNPGTDKPENTWFKAIKGNDNFYVAQKAFKFEPTAEQVEQWTRYLRSVTVCDTRLAERTCPKVGGGAK